MLVCVKFCNPQQYDSKSVTGYKIYRNNDEFEKRTAEISYKENITIPNHMEQKRTMNRSDVQQVHNELEEPLDYMLIKSKLFPDCYEGERRDYHH